ncbi:Flp family type IVb pilin [Pseudovibrio exalbescens]|uniref:Flp family type IVb pilin n=1 Tax=Pseudovibrio exalbescens TaxID=197461 RepID=UPI000B159C54
MVCKRQGSDVSRAGFTIAHMNKDERGNVAIEYALIAGLIALAIVGSLGAINNSMNGVFTETSTALERSAD